MILRIVRPPSGVVVSVVIAVAVAGCGVGDAPPASEPRPTYQQIPRDLCDQVEFEDVAQRFDLAMAPRSQHDSSYARERNSWYESCWFTAEAEDNRFAPEVRNFDPHGPVRVEVFDDLMGAVDAYEQDARGALEYRADQEPNATTAELTGWWDNGIALQWLREPNPAAADPEQPPNLVVEHMVLHENLVVWATLTTLSAPTKDVVEALELLHDLAAALIDEAVGHLTLVE